MIIGNLTRDPELRYTASGTSIATFGVATNREYVPGGSEDKVEETEFHNVVAWSKLAELCDQLLEKGQKVYIEGRLNTRDWVDDQSGKKMYRTEIIAEEMIVLSSPRNYSPDSSGELVEDRKESRVDQGSQSREQQDDQSTTSGDDAEIPF